jgi:hypothetical protein
MSAVISPCGRYRYHLRRQLDWQPGLFRLRHERLVFVMLNPSTADAEEDDATIRRCVGFAKRESAGAVEVVNLYALRSKERKDLLAHPEPVGPDNDDWIARTVETASLVIAAWGSFSYEKMPQGRDRTFAVLDLIRDKCETGVHCLHATKAGFPGHPLYLDAGSELRPYTNGGGRAPQ